MPSRRTYKKKRSWAPQRMSSTMQQPLQPALYCIPELCLLLLLLSCWYSYPIYICKPYQLAHELRPVVCSGRSDPQSSCTVGGPAQHPFHTSCTPCVTGCVDHGHIYLPPALLVVLTTGLGLRPIALLLLEDRWHGPPCRIGISILLLTPVSTSSSSNNIL